MFAYLATLSVVLSVLVLLFTVSASTARTAFLGGFVREEVTLATHWGRSGGPSNTLPAAGQVQTDRGGRGLYDL